MYEEIKDFFFELAKELGLSKTVGGLEHLIYHIFALLPYLIVVAIVYDAYSSKYATTTLLKIFYFIFMAIVGGLSWILNVDDWRRNK